jgi:hypothetical protein
VRERVRGRVCLIPLLANHRGHLVELGDHVVVLDGVAHEEFPGATRVAVFYDVHLCMCVCERESVCVCERG